MFRRILVALDGSVGGETALAYVTRFEARDARLIFLCAPRVASRLLPSSASSIVARGPFVDEAARAADDFDVDLIILCAPRRLGLTVLRRCLRPVLVPGTGTDARPLRRILVPYGSLRDADAILPVVRSIVPVLRAEVFLLHVLAVHCVTRDGMGGFAPAGFTVLRSHQERIDPELQALDARKLVRSGDPSREILRAAAALDVDLIAMATSAPPALRRLILGSTSADVLQGAERPVLLSPA